MTPSLMPAGPDAWHTLDPSSMSVVIVIVIVIAVVVVVAVVGVSTSLCFVWEVFAVRCFV